MTDDQGAGKVPVLVLSGTWQRQIIDWLCVSCQLSRVLDVYLAIRHWVGPDCTIF